MSVITLDKKYNRLFFISVGFFVFINALLIGNAADSVAGKIIFYAVNLLVCVFTVFCFRLAVRRDDSESKGSYALVLAFLIEPCFLFNSLYSSDLGRTIAYVAFCLALFAVRGKKTAWLVPPLLLVMMLASPITAIALLPFAVLMLCCEGIADPNKRNFTPAVVCVVTAIVITVLASALRDSSFSRLIFFGATKSVFLTTPSALWHYLPTVLKSFILPELPVFAVLAFIWKRAVAADTDGKLRYFRIVNAALSALTLILSVEQFPYVLCGVQLIILTYSYVNGNAAIVSAVDEAVRRAKAHPYITGAAIIWCSYFRLNYFFFGDIVTGGDSIILESLRRLM